MDLINTAAMIMLSGSGGGGTTNTDFDKLVQEAESSNCLLEFDIVEGVYTGKVVVCSLVPPYTSDTYATLPSGGLQILCKHIFAVYTSVRNNL